MKRNENKSKSNRSLAVLCALLAVTLVGCNEPVADEPVTSASEVQSEEVSEEVSDEASEEISEEVAEKELYSAQEVMTLIDNLTAKYQYNDPEHIKALVIAANLDYIAAEDLDTILATYGYTMDELSALYNECARDNAFSIGDTMSYYSGDVNSISPEQEYDNRITLTDIMLNESDKQLATSFDEKARLTSHNDVDAYMTLADMMNFEYSTSGEQVVANFVYVSFNSDFMENPYATYQNTMAK